MTTENRKNYDRQHVSPSGRPTPDELKLIRDTIVLPYAITMAEKAQKSISDSEHLFRWYYASMTQQILDQMSLDLSQMNRELRARNIKVVPDETLDDIIYYTFFCRGYSDRISIMRETLRSEITNKLAVYGTNLLMKLKS